jgi:hypothetical protein
MEKKYVNYVEFCHINYLFIKLGDKLNKIIEENEKLVKFSFN